MTSFGSKIKPLHFQCQAHGVQLSVCDVLYKKNKKKPDPDNDEVMEVNGDNGNENDDTNGSEVEDDGKYLFVACLSL